MTTHVKQPDRMVARRRVPGKCSCGQPWPHQQVAADLTPGQRLVRARWNLKYVAEQWITNPEPPAGSDEARLLYEAVTVAARELVAAQDAFDSWCHDNAARQMPGREKG